MDQFDERGVMGHHLIRGHILTADPNCIADGTPVQYAGDALIDELEVVSFRVVRTDMDRVHSRSGEGEQRQWHFVHLHFVDARFRVGVWNGVIGGYFGLRGFFRNSVANEVMGVGVN